MANLLTNDTTLLKENDTMTVQRNPHTWTIREIMLEVLGMVIIISNLLNIIVICMFPNLRTRTNGLLASLGMVDLLV